MPTFLAALRHDRIDAPAVLDGPINGPNLLTYVEQFLIPTLKLSDAIILNHLGSHTPGCARRHLIRAMSTLNVPPARFSRSFYFSTVGLTGDPTAPVKPRGGAHSRKLF